MLTKLTSKKMDNLNLIDYIYKGHRWLSELEKTPRDYGTGEKLNPSAVHTLVAIDRKPGNNLTQLAVEMGISKAAVSKFTSQLVKRGYLVRHAPKKEQGREICFSLTDRGKIAVNGHVEFTRNTFKHLVDIEHRLPLNEREIIRRYLEALASAIGK
jgi:DNA-binding MarR family transcriptional regulator